MTGCGAAWRRMAAPKGVLEPARHVSNSFSVRLRQTAPQTNGLAAIVASCPVLAGAPSLLCELGIRPLCRCFCC